MKTIHFIIFSALFASQQIFSYNFNKLNEYTRRQQDQIRNKKLEAKKETASCELDCINKATNPDQLLSCLLHKNQSVQGFVSNDQLMLTLNKKHDQLGILKNDLTNGYNPTNLELGETRDIVKREFSEERFKETKNYITEYKKNEIKYYDILGDNSKHISEEDRIKILGYLFGHYGVLDEKVLEKLIKKQKLDSDPIMGKIDSLVHVLNWANQR